MEQQAERSHLNSQLQAYRIISIIALSLAALSFYFVIFLYIDKVKMKTQLKQMSSSIETMKGDAVFTPDYKKGISFMSKMSALQMVQHGAESLVSTDEFIVDKLHLLFDPDDETFEVLITIRMLRGKESLYKGDGEFNLTDNELRTKGEEIVAEVKEYYRMARKSTSILPKWKDKNVFLSIEYHDIGDTTSGKFKLVGEK
ncbi:hypothetical protein [Cohnella sp. WQ 127256]|uniref:hypothetical protein n=1 Tax=Cohnella sp. WQ 127256 TaxID=2938790 RepID=UPI002118297C|nr:hypothetical protein [Cohnella sp. WQ 127256]